MTNKEKAREIANETLGDFATSFLGMIDEYSEMFCTKAALRMAEWKDNQIKEYLEKKISEIVSARGRCPDDFEQGINYEKELVIQEIINELFPEQEQDNSDNDE